MTPKIYLAGAVKAYDEIIGRPLLVSYAEKSQIQLISFGYSNDFLVDSGAFTVWKRGKSINIDSYCEFINENEKKFSRHVKGYFSLDVIGGTMEENIYNFEYIKSNVVSPKKIIPVFHEMDDFSLMRYFYEGDSVLIGLSLTKSRGKSNAIEHLKKISSQFPSVCDGGSAMYHGLGITNTTVLREMKSLFYSVDSTTWLNFAKYGFKASLSMLEKKDLKTRRKMGVLCMDSIFEDDYKRSHPSSKEAQKKHLPGNLNFLDTIGDY